MSRRPTPETDAERREGLIRGNAVPTHVVPVEFAEELERERDDARERCAKFCDIAERAVSLGIKGTGHINGIVEYFNGSTKFAFKGKTK
jgi:hypothetical protein